MEKFKNKGNSSNIMTNVIILHGTGCNPNLYWYPYIKQNLENKGYDVWVPTLPNTEEADLKEWLSFILENGIINEETILIGHSAGSALILSILEKINVKIKQAILVAGFIDLDSKILQTSYDWNKIKSNIDDIIFINSDDDPWGCNDTQGKKMFDKLGGTLIIRHGEGHMGSSSYNQPYKEFPFLLKLIK